MYLLPAIILAIVYLVQTWGMDDVPLNGTWFLLIITAIVGAVLQIRQSQIRDRAVRKHCTHPRIHWDGYTEYCMRCGARASDERKSNGQPKVQFNEED